jgi:alanine-glyoxylate transaminase/serine-glyoxylate transaminase/serine-pyruvate transaminase
MFRPIRLQHVSIKHRPLVSTFCTSNRRPLLFGPGPANPYPRTLLAMSRDTLGHLHPSFIPVMNSVKKELQRVFQTSNKVTFPLSATGSGAMEASLVNLLEPGESVAIVCHGYWGDRITNMALRQNLKPIRIEGPWGKVIPVDKIAKIIKQQKPHALFVVHGESSTGICQPLHELKDICGDTLLIADTVVTLGGMPVFTDKWRLDVVYSGSQKCLSCTPGLSLISFSERAMDKIRKRKTAISSFYFDVLELHKYWGDDKIYHHTAAINNIYALDETLKHINTVGLPTMWCQHKDVAEYFYQQLNLLKLQPLVPNVKDRLLPLTTVRIPDGINGKAVQRDLVNNHGIEIAGGLGQLAGKVWRIGFMGSNATRENVDIFMEAFGDVLNKHGFNNNYINDRMCI